MLRILKVTAEKRGRWSIIPLLSGWGQRILYWIQLWVDRRDVLRDIIKYRFVDCSLYHFPAHLTVSDWSRLCLCDTSTLSPLAQGLCVFTPPNLVISRPNSIEPVSCHEIIGYFKISFKNWCRENGVKWNNDDRSNQRIVFDLNKRFVLLLVYY